MSLPSIVLNNTSNGANKTYQVSMGQVEGGYTVNFAYGKIGNTLRNGTKTQQPIDYDKAQKVFDKLVQSKVSKGYVPQNDEDAVAFNLNDKTSDHSGVNLQLLNPVNTSVMDELVDDSVHCLQRKYDGERRAVNLFMGMAKGINKKGNYVPLPSSISDELSVINHALIDGELIGETLFVFDLLSFEEQDFTTLPYQERFEKLKIVVDLYQLNNVELVESAFTPEDKKALFQKMKEEGREGVVFKRLDKPYTPHRPASWGDQLKYKFTESVSAIVGNINDKRSVALNLVSGEEQINIGNVTIPVNKAIPQVGDIVEVNYLYANPASHKLIQPTFKCPRKTVSADECTLSQLKYQQDELA